MENIDNFFQEIHNKHQQKKEINAPKISEKIDDLLGDFMGNFEQNKTNKAASNEDLFADIKQNFTQKKPQEKTQNKDLFDDIKSNFKQKTTNTKEVKSQASNQKLDDVFADVTSKFVDNKEQKKTKKLADSKLSEIQSQYQQKKAQSEVNKPSNIEAIKQEELKKQRERKVLMKQAEAWLKQLDPYSDEGFWFQQFTEGYESKLEAAIDYLSALNNRKM